MHIINLIRAKDWLKNILIFFPLIFSGLLFEHSHYTTLFIGFITFNILASCIYVINDILDIKEDKLHPIKKLTKPIASNKITLNSSYVVLFFLIISCLTLVYFQPIIYTSVFFYLFITLSYNFIFKKIPYLELIILSIGYVIRIDAGSRLILVESSILMLTSTFFLALFFLTIKRLGEINHFESTSNYVTRYILKFYSKKILQRIIIILIFFLVLNLIIYTIIRDVNLILSVIFVFLFLIKYFRDTKDNTRGENPINLILSSKLLLLMSLLIILSSLVIYIN